METKVESFQDNELIQALQALIRSYMNKNQSLTINALGMRSGIPVTTLRRLVNGEQKSEIAPHSVLNLTSYIYREKNLALLLTKIDAAIAIYLQRHFGSFIFSSEVKAVYEVSLNEELKDFSKYIIYKLASNHSGVDWFSVTSLFGALGRKKAQELMEKNHLYEKEERLHAKDKNFSLDLEVAASLLPELVAFYKPDTIQQGKNSFFNLSESLTVEAISEIRAIQRECVNKIYTVMSDEKNLGDIPYFTINLSEALVLETQTGEIQ